MATYSGEIEKYFVNIISPQTSSGSLITLRGEFGRAVLKFLPEGATLPDNRKHDTADHFDIYYPRDHWAPIIDILRNEKPIYFQFTTPSGHTQIMTSMEPVGEEESVEGNSD